MSGGSMQFQVAPGGQLNGELRVPGDKSISHRAAMFASLAEGRSHVSGFLDGADCLATLRAFEAMGVRAQREGQNLVVEGQGLHGLAAPTGPLDLGNSGTSMRLMAGLMAGQSFATTLTGDRSLSVRPMGRVVQPLQQMGANIQSNERGCAPLQIAPSDGLYGIDYTSPVASAQVKSALLLAGLYAQGWTRITEPGASRDHSERMLQAFGLEVEARPGFAALSGGQTMRATDIQVPADISSAAFFLVGAAISPGSELLLQSVGVNPTRTGVIDVLRAMGAQIEVQNERIFGGEPVADLWVRGGALQGIDIDPALVASAIDEFPALFVAAACAEGVTRVTGAEELRVKESDRISAMVNGLKALGIEAEGTPDGAVIQGGRLQGGQVDSLGDHRVAMSFAMAALRASDPISILDCDNVNTSFPGFAVLAAQAGLTIEVRR